MSRYSGKRVIVTGAASGIGHATAEALLAEGAEVFSLDRNEPTAAVTGHVKVDLSDPDSIDAALADLEGSFDVLFNVAGLPGTAPAEIVLAVNALAVRHVSEAVLERLNPGGSVVIVSSTAGFGWPDRLETIKDLLTTDTFADGVQWFADHPQEGNAYNFSKEVATVYTMLMALVFAEAGLRINAVLPGPVETPILADFEETMGHDNLDGLKELLGRHARPEEIAKAALFLGSDDASWVNGHPLVVEGGAFGAVYTGLVPAPQI